MVTICDGSISCPKHAHVIPTSCTYVLEGQKLSPVPSSQVYLAPNNFLVLLLFPLLFGGFFSFTTNYLLASIMYELKSKYLEP